MSTPLEKAIEALECAALELEVMYDELDVFPAEREALQYCRSTLKLLRAQPQEWPSGITALFSNDSRYHFVQIGDKKYILSLPEEYEAKEAERVAARALRCAWVDSWRSGSALDKEAFSINYDAYKDACAKVDELSK